MKDQLEFRLPGLAAHADWSKNQGKRWVVSGIKGSDGRFRVYAPQPAGELRRMLADLRARIKKSDSLLVGFDFPIGLPLCYARKCGIDSFLEWLPEAGTGRWWQFFEPAYTPDEIRLTRPFYPQKPGRARQKHLLAGLGVSKIDDLRRGCELPHEGRRAAAPLFWTLGGQQVGKAAICGWRDLIQPALSGDAGVAPGTVKIWPFSGRLDVLLDSADNILCETYPAECYNHLGVRFQRAQNTKRPAQGMFPSGKTSQAGRAANAHNILQRMDELGLIVEPDLKEKVQVGFGAALTGEDQFDALIGLVGMLNVLLGHQPLAEPPAGPVRDIEGWIFGQKFVDCDSHFQ